MRDDVPSSGVLLERCCKVNIHPFSVTTLYAAVISIFGHIIV